MNITIDNIFAFLIFFVLILAFMGFIVPSTYLPFTTTEQHQLEEIARALLDKMLFGTGYPENWGSNLSASGSSLTAFGLHKAKGDSYQLDINKVLKISSQGAYQLPSTIQIPPEVVAQLLGMRGPRRYEFSVSITPALNISYQILGNFSLDASTSVPALIAATVLNPDGRPAANANVTGLYLLMNVRKKGQDEIVYLNYTYYSKVTNWEGKTTLNFTTYLKALKDQLKTSELKRTISAMTLYAEYFGIRSVASSVMNQALFGTMIDKYLIVDFPIDQLPRGARQMQNATALSIPPFYVYLDYLHNDTNGQSGMVINAGSKKYRVYELGQGVDEDVTFICVPVKYRGDYQAVIFMRPPVDVICQTGIPGQIKTSVLRRLVRIGSWHYILELMTWRSAEF